MSSCKECDKLKKKLEASELALEDLREKYHKVELLFPGWAPDGEGLSWKIRNRMKILAQMDPTPSYGE